MASPYRGRAVHGAAPDSPGVSDDTTGVSNSAVHGAAPDGPGVSDDTTGVSNGAVHGAAPDGPGVADDTTGVSNGAVPAAGDASGPTAGRGAAASRPHSDSRPDSAADRHGLESRKMPEEDSRKRRRRITHHYHSSSEEDCPSWQSPLGEDHQTRQASAKQDSPTGQSTHDDSQTGPSSPAEDHLTHRELETVYRDTLAGLLASDPLLGDLPAALTPPEVRSLTALEHGTAMAVLVNRGDRLTRVIVERTATVRDLKLALRAAVQLEQARRGGRRKISWRYVWRAHWLAFQGRRLTEDGAALAELGLGNRAEVCFVPRIRPKRGQRDKKGGQV